MKLNGRRTEDDEIEIDVQKAAQAYELFKQSRKDGGKANVIEFENALKSVLALIEAEVHPNASVLYSKTVLSNWRTSPPKAVKRRHSVLIAVLSVTGLDISTRGILARLPLNLSPISELAPLKSHKLTNDPEEVREAIFEIELVELILKASVRTVISDWLVKPTHKPQKTDPFEVGTVEFGLKEANIQIDFGETDPQEWTRYISAATDPSLGRADGCVILWNQERKTWIVQPTEGSPMRVRLENVKLCKTKGPRGAIVSLAVTVVEDQVYSDFRMKLQVNRHGEPERSTTSVLAGERLTTARERLFSIVLAHRPEGPSILSYQRHKLP